ncbi:C-C motif chemokine 20 [Sinocyclocheilus rhinocerous]|uniref:C-C motif chemokine 20-like n=1 Tax=Sinocyclocheilus rhinocerous TaxID=307959 RepID=A0A673KRM9_9TELE|nr:PREDICTED: C-C motif chemokine 20-like [Sinocyclocheilus rhinocerous]
MRCIMSLLTITLISSILLSLFPHTPAAYGPLNYACCVKYTRNPLPFGVIKGFIEQSSLEVCRIDAIIFFTKNNRKVCASVEDQWVRAALARLRSKITKLTVKGTPRINTAGLKRTIHTTTKSP